MANNGTSQADLDRGIVSSAPAAARVGEVSRLLPMVLLHDVDRVQQEFAVWRTRYDVARRVHLMETLTQHWADWATAEVVVTADPGIEALIQDATHLFGVVKDLGLAKYRWLPRHLAMEFGRVALGVAAPLEVTFPDGLAWATPGKRPKQRPGVFGGFRLEDLERNVTWFVACKVNGKRIKRFAIAQGVSRSTVQDAIKRVEILLDCINRPLPTTPSCNSGTPLS
jgi:hypothetical protein